jgi:methionyl-tRNA synthetase
MQFSYPDRATHYIMKDKFYITTSIPYTNAPPHVGHILEFIQADVLARYNTLLKRDVFFLTGTDDHGIKIAKAAKDSNKTPEEFVSEMSKKFKDLKNALNLTNNDFISTEDRIRHWPVVKKLWEKIQENGDFYKKKYKGFYCVGHETFHLNIDLANGECPDYPGIKLELVEEENYFFKLSKYLPEVKNIIQKDKIRIIPKSKKKEILEMIKNGLDDVSFSRSKDKYWGIPVPGDSGQIIYVWADALPNYISALGYGTNNDKFKKYWPANVHCIGKDIVKFHAIYWPAMLLSLGLKMPETIFVHGFITVNSQKMSKSIGNVVDPFELIKKYGTDPVRYYLLREITPTEDGDFTYEKFEQRYNSDLAGGIGNLLSRTIALAKKPNFESQKPSKKIKEAIKKTEKESKEYLEEFKFNESLKSIWELIGFCDKYINEKKPWEAKENFSQVVCDLIFALDKISELLSTFLPETSEKIKNSLKFKKSEQLFPRLLNLHPNSRGNKEKLTE